MDETMLRTKKQDDSQYMDTIYDYDCVNEFLEQNRTSYRGFSNLFNRKLNYINLENLFHTLSVFVDFGSMKLTVNFATRTFGFPDYGFKKRQV